MPTNELIAEIQWLKGENAALIAMLEKKKGLLKEAAALVKSGTMIIGWPNVEAMALQKECRQFLANPEIAALMERKEGG